MSVEDKGFFEADASGLQGLVFDALLAENPLLDASYNEDIGVDDLLLIVQNLLSAFLGATVPRAHLQEELAQVFPHVCVPSKFAAHTWLLSTHVADLVGPTAAASVHRQTFCDALGLPPPSEDVAAMNANLVQEIVHLRRGPVVPLERTVKRRRLSTSRAPDAIRAAHLAKIGMVNVAAKNHVAMQRVPTTLVDCARLIDELTEGRGRAIDVEDVLFGRLALGRELLLVADALQLLLRDRIQGLRDNGRFFGVGFCSDESPPGSKRFTGLRFQVTWICLPVFEPVREWGNDIYDKAPPVAKVEWFLLDIVHCPGKDGATVMHVLQKQWWRVGLTRDDVVSGTGDGGGENEGAAGIHSVMEASNPGYVRRRCTGHFCWRSVEKAWDVMAKERRFMFALLRYFHGETGSGAWRWPPPRTSTAGGSGCFSLSRRATGTSSGKPRRKFWTAGPKATGCLRSG